MKIISMTNMAQSFPIAIVVSSFNQEITDKLLAGAIERLQELGIPSAEITVVWVPGAVEIPFLAQQLAKTKRYAVIIALGAVIRGDTTHYDYVCQQVSQGCQQVMLAEEIPVIFGVLTTEDEEQALARVGGAHGHKGRDAADAAYQMVSVLQRLKLF